MQEGVSSPTATPISSAANVQRIMPVLYVGQSSVKPVPSSSPGLSASTTGPTILTAMPQIQLAGGTNHPHQIIHSSPSPNTYSYVPVRQVYQQTKTIKEAPKKVFVTSINSPHNNKSNQVNLIIPNNPNSNPVNKPIFPTQTSLILPHQLGTVSNKGTITGMLVPNNPTSTNTNKSAVASLLLPTNSKYPTIAPNKKVPIPNILIPQQNIASKQSSVPNIIRQTPTPTGKNVVGILSSSSNQTNSQMTSLLLAPNNNSSNKQTPTSMGLILPTSGGASHSIIVPQSSSGQNHGIIMPQSSGPQSHSIIMPQATGPQSHSIVVPHSTGCQSQVTNLIITSSNNLTHTTNTSVASLLISQSGGPSNVGSSHMTSLLIPQTSAGCSSPVSGLVGPATPAKPGQQTSILVPVSVGPNKVPAPYSNGKKALDNKSMMLTAARENKQSVLMKTSGEGAFPSLPPLQPIGTKSDVGTKTPVIVKQSNGLNVSVPESLIMTPIIDCDTVKNKPVDKISDEMTIERTPVGNFEEQSSLHIKLDEREKKAEEECKRSDIGSSLSGMSSLRGTDQDEGLVLDGEVTVRRLGPHREDVPEQKQLEDDVKIELVKPASQKLPPPRYQKPEDLNPMDVLEWDHQGVGKLPGSNIKFRINEYGLDLVVDNNKDDSISSKSNTPNSSRRNSDEKGPTSDRMCSLREQGEETDKIYCCEGCGCYGLYTEFLMDTRFCSVGCKKIVLVRNEIKKKRMDEKVKEMRLRRKRKKLKILAQQRTKKDSDEQKSNKEQDDKKVAPPEEVDLISKAWSNKMAELRKTKKSTEGSLKISSRQGSEGEESRAASPASDSEASINMQRSSLPPSNPPSNPPSCHVSDDDASSDQTAVTSDTGKETTWLSSSGEFMWSAYLQKCCKKAKSAPIKLFKDPFPYGKNGFKVGMKLEGIDPEHQAVISVLTIAQVKGHRIRLHFDGYPDHHDFWANSDSPDIFPPGWCERNNHTLHPPRGYCSENFSWNVYLKQCRAQPAPKSLFPKSNTPLCPSQFRVGMKLEAVDRKNSSLICVASVADLIDNRLLIHFDSWGDVYDYWTDPSSPYIHPVGWCEENGHDLTPPSNYKNPSLFSWEAYLKETKSQAAPARAFKPRSPNLFKRGMKLEAIDKRAASILRPATVKEVMEYQIKIEFDGFPEDFGYWVDDDCPDIHPTGWGHKTGHPVTPPPIGNQVVLVKNECGTKGCCGDGNIKGGFLTKHVTAATCPYSPTNLNKETVPDRFCVNPDFYEVPESTNRSKGTSTRLDNDDSNSSESRVKTRNSTSVVIKEEIKEEGKIKVEIEEKIEERVERRGRKRKLPDAEYRVEQLDRLRKELIVSVIDPGYKPSPVEQEMWVKHVAALGHKVNVTGGDPRTWNHKQVAAFVNTVIPSRAKLFLDQEIDGESFLMLTQNDLTQVLGLRLGPALKIYNCIILLRQKVMTL